MTWDQHVTARARAVAAGAQGPARRRDPGQLGQVVDRSPETVRRYLNQLEEAGKISKNGQGVEVIAR